MTLRASTRPAEPGAATEPGSASRSGKRHGQSRAAHSPLPLPVLALGVLGACAIVLPFVGLGTRVAWTELPTLLTSQAATRALGLSLRTCVIATVISVCLGVPLALLLARQWRGVRVGRVLAVLPMTMPPVVAGIALLATLGKRGLLGRTLSVMDVQISFTTTAVVIAQVFVAMPYLVVTLEAALRSRDTHVETIARTLGAGPWTLLTRITLPLVGPALARGTALALGRSLGEFGATIAFAGSKEGVTRTMPLAIYLERENDTATSLALAVVLIAMSFLIVGATNISWPELVRRLPHPSHPSRRAQMSSPRSTTASRPVPTAPRGLDLHVSFASAQRNVTADLEVGAGRTLALIGPNGSGKSTVCGVVAGLLDADGGRVLLGERELDGPSGFVPAGRRDVALLSQAPGIFTHMSVLDNVAFGPRCRHVTKGAARERAHAELEAAGVEHLAARRGSELSGGQAARVALARALATSPRLLVLDEPMSALDVTARREMRRLVARRAAEEGLTVLLVTHDVLDITALAEDIAVLENGRVAERGTTAKVLAAPVSDFAARLTGTAVLTGRLAGDDESPALKLDEGQVVHGRPRSDGGDDGDSWDGEGAGGSRESLRLGGPGIALVPPDAVAMYREPPQGSPRNVLAGRVTGVDRAGALVSVEVRLTGGQTIRAAVTAGAVAEMGIAVDQELWCAIKAVEVRIVPRRERDSAARRSRAGAEESAAERAE